MALIGPQKNALREMFAQRLSRQGYRADENDSFVQRLGEESSGVKKMAKGGVVEDESGDSDMATEMAMGAFLRAHERKDVRGMAAALKDFMYLCDDDSGEEEDEGPEIEISLGE